MESTSSIDYNFKANNNYIINTCLEIPFTEEEIEQGIRYGEEKRNNKRLTKQENLNSFEK